ncbi:uncharacterized protein EAE97_000660 [Botrytis byssoidea]|uniref:SGNH hydrolase-type esterase domain-containing protein n=1 Tax=Botrytis byssoidea TaxID=139641 RepID=A0A9P5IZA2_9HELO|nr:uncharacterized protein EAE97_000660 [Botrytis byssoidea]KAF7955401.1 hypothetical protein EAE97_000660 [Botrytis byssoidea]
MSSSTASSLATTTKSPKTNYLLLLLQMSDIELDNQIKDNSKWKKRSEETTLGVHFPELDNASLGATNLVLIGSSMLERFKTTGHDLILGSKPVIFNAGVGGDTIPNVLYRINLGLLRKAKTQEKVGMVIINIGSNDLKKPGRSLTEAQLYQFALHLEALRRTFPRARIVVTALFYKKDVHLLDVDRSNEDLQNLVSGLPGVEWLAAPEVELDNHYEDHVHLNRAGYEIWDRWLVDKLGI